MTGVRGVIIVNSTDPRNPLQCEPIGFESKEFTTQQFRIPRKLRPLGADGRSGREIDLFDDLVHDGKLEIWIRCDDPVQYFGMAQADLYIEAPKASFQWNFVKAYISIWLQMVIVVCLGVMFSTFLSSPVAILATLPPCCSGSSAVRPRSVDRRSLWRRPDRSVDSAGQSGQSDQAAGIWHGANRRADRQVPRQILLTIMNALATVLPDFSGLGRADRIRRVQLQLLRSIAGPAVPDHTGLCDGHHHRGLLLPENAGNRRMTQNASFIRKIVYGCAIVVLLFPLFLLGQPATRRRVPTMSMRHAGFERRHAGSDARQLRTVPGRTGQDRSGQRDDEDGDARAARRGDQHALDQGQLATSERKAGISCPPHSTRSPNCNRTTSRSGNSRHTTCPTTCRPNLTTIATDTSGSRRASSS